jgi:hypothetical protein
MHFICYILIMNKNNRAGFIGILLTVIIALAMLGAGVWIVQSDKNTVDQSSAVTTNPTPAVISSSLGTHIATLQSVAFSYPEGWTASYAYGSANPDSWQPKFAGQMDVFKVGSKKSDGSYDSEFTIRLGGRQGDSAPCKEQFGGRTDISCVDLPFGPGYPLVTTSHDPETLKVFETIVATAHTP